jgi:hypothetical protein
MEGMVRCSVLCFTEVCEYQAQRLVACEHHEMMRVVRQGMSNYRTTGSGLVAIIRPYQHSGCHEESPDAVFMQQEASPPVRASHIY